MDIKFSVAIPAFKGKYLKESIQSVLDQTYTNLECIIVNDASPEDLDSIVSQFDDSRIIYSRNSSGFGAYNVSKNWDKCLSFASGDYFICIGDDDILLPNCLQEYIDLINRYPGKRVYHARTQIINNEGVVYDLQESRPESETCYSMIWHQWMVGRKSWIGDYCFETKTLKESGGFIWFPYAWGSEFATVYYQASFAGIANMQRFGFQYRCHDSSISANTKDLTGKAESMMQYRQWFKAFLEQSSPLDEMDVLYYDLIMKRFDSLFTDSIMMIIRDDTHYNRLRHFRYWLKNKESFGISSKQIYKSVLIGLRKALF